MDKYQDGYPKVAAAAVSDPNFTIVRKFAWLQFRVILRLQDELSELEDDLKDLDHFDYGNDPRKLKSRRRDEGINSARKDLLFRIEQKLAAYGQYHEIVRHDSWLSCV